MAKMQQKIATEFNGARTFGIEIEFFGVNYQTVVSSLKAAGINVAYESYNHTTRRHWKLITDVSVTSTDTGVGRGLELVSPPLAGKAGLEELRKVMETLTAVGAKVDKTCGMHVHHHAADLGLQGFKNLYGIYYKFESWVDSMVAPSRRADANRFCQGISSAILDRVQAATSLENLSSILSNRYVKLNFASYYKYGTVEFRQHGGSVDAEKAINWIVFTQSMVERAAGSKVRFSVEEKETDLNKLERQFRRMIFGDYKAGCLANDYGVAFQFQVSRRHHFASRVA